MTAQGAVAILESLSEAVIAIDRNWRCTYVNSAAERLTGRPREELLGRACRDTVSASLGQGFESACRRAMSEGATVPFEDHSALFDTSLEGAASPSDIGVVVHARDTTETKRAEAELRKSEERLRRYFELDLVGTAITSPDKGILAINDKICDILGYERDELLQRSWAELTHPDDLDADLADFNRVLAGEIDGYSLDKRWVRKDGSVVDSTISVKCLRRQDGSVECFVALLQDNTERKRVEQERERLALFVENSSEFIAICDLSLTPTFMNRAGREMVGLENRDGSIPKTVAEFFFPEDASFIQEEFLPHVLREGAGKVEVRFRHFKTREALWMMCSALVLSDARGTPTELATIGHNITERKEAEEAARRARDELEKRVAERTSELQIANDELKQEIGKRQRVEREWVALKGELAADLEAMKRLNQLSRRFFTSDGPQSVIQELLDATIDLQHADFGLVQLHDPLAKTPEVVAQHGFQQEFLDHFRVERDGSVCSRALQRRERIVIEDVEADAGFEPHRHIAANAGFRAVQSTPLLTLDGEPLGVLSTYFRRPHRPSERELRLTDLFALKAAQIIERQRVEAAVRRNEAYLSMGERLSHIGSWSVNVLTEEVFWTDEAYRIYGFDPGSVKPSGELFFQVVVHPEDRPALEAAFAQVVRCGSKHDLSFRIVRPDGTIRHIHSVGEPVFREDGVLVEVIGTVMDLTEQKLAADALHKAHTELAQIARATALGELAASIAHEANQPIAAIVSNGDACLKWINRPDPNWTEARAAVERMISEGLRASEVIKSVRSLMKRAPLRMLELGINDIIGEVLILVQREVVSHSISVHTDLADDLPGVIGDRIHLQQVLVNLLMNAIEAMIACGEGPRTILIRTQLKSPDQIGVTIRDSGVGIIAEKIEQLFEPFFSNKTDGMGMGLWISRSIVEAHGGSLWATPNEDSGATFHFTLPANR